MWPAQITRGNAAITVSKVTQYLVNLTVQHLEAALHCASYLSYNKYEGLCPGDVSTDLVVDGLASYVDPSFMNNENTRRSTCGMVFMSNGRTVFWKSGHQPIVTLSTTEAEYVAMTLAAKEAIALKRMVEELTQGKQGSHGAVTLYEDNKPSIDLLNKAPGTDFRSKHIALRYHFIR
jgi:hypothetical protein